MKENTELTNQIHHCEEAQMSSLWQRVSQVPPASFPSDWKLCKLPLLMNYQGKHTKNSEFWAMRKGLKIDPIHEAF